MNLARQKTCKVLMQVHQKFVIHLAEPIWIRDRLEALSYSTIYFSTVVWARWKVSCKRMSREELPTKILKLPASETQPAFAGS